MSHHRQIKEKKLLFVILFNFTIAITEFFGGILSHSLSLLSDSFHNLTDTVAIAMAYLALKIGQRPADKKRTFGYKRIEIITAFINASIMLVVIVFMIYEALKRLKNPVIINFNLMLIIASVGLIGNLLSILFLKNERHGDLNTRAVFLHLFSDFISSILVILGAIFIKLFHIYYLDSILTIIIVLLLLKETLLIIKESISILLESTPSNIEIDKLAKTIKDLSPRIENIHHIHLWSINEKDILMECHIRLNKDLNIGQVDEIKKKVNGLLEKEYSIHHSNIQFELEKCKDEDIIRKK
ncbi:cation transporter [bacterium]|nr:cation transporter [bacterium]